MNSFAIFLILGLASNSVRAQCPDVANLETVPAVLAECLTAVTDASRALTNNPLVLADGSTFSTYVDLLFVTKEGTAKICCDDFGMKDHLYQMKPLSTEPEPMESMREEPDLTFVHQDSADDTALFSVVMLDTTMPDNNPWLNWLKYNVPGNDPTQGTIGMLYDGPEDGNLLNVFLFKQQAEITTFDITQYVDASAEGCGNNRCIFDIAKFVADNSLTQVGMNWGEAEKTDYKDHREYERSTDRKSLCTGQPKVLSVVANEPVCEAPPPENHGDHLHSNIFLLLGIYVLKAIWC